MYLINESTKVLGVDVFICQKEMPIFESSYGKFKPILISNRGTKIWPGPKPSIELVDVFRCRFKADGISHSEVLDLLKNLEAEGFEWVHIEKLLELNGKAAYSKADGE